MGPGEAIAAVGFFGMLIAVVCVGGVSFQRWVSYKQRKAELDAEAHRATLSERGDYAEMLEERVRVLERIATDRGLDLAHEIEALRDRQVLPQLERGSPVS
ncbi:MAG: hypothetical protein ACXWI5_07700 [Croceibacterium sp.]